MVGFFVKKSRLAARLSAPTIEAIFTSLSPLHDGAVVVTEDRLLRLVQATDALVWKMGGIAHNRDGARLIRIQGDPETGFNYQHDARLRPNGNVSLLSDPLPRVLFAQLFSGVAENAYMTLPRQIVLGRDYMITRRRRMALFWIGTRASPVAPSTGPSASGDS
jgi:hypothetical protein